MVCDDGNGAVVARAEVEGADVAHALLGLERARQRAGGVDVGLIHDGVVGHAPLVHPEAGED